MNSSGIAISKFNTSLCLDEFSAFNKHLETWLTSEIETLKKHWSDASNSLEKDERHVDLIADDIFTFASRFAQISRRSLYLTVYGYAEHNLNRVCNLARRLTVNPISVSDLSGHGIHRAKKYLARTFGQLPVFRGEPWQEFNAHRVIRNSFTHSDGIFSESDSKTREAGRLLESKNRIMLRSMGEHLQIDLTSQSVALLTSCLREFFHALYDDVQNAWPLGTMTKRA